AFLANLGGGLDVEQCAVACRDDWPAQATSIDCPDLERGIIAARDFDASHARRGSTEQQGADRHQTESFCLHRLPRNSQHSSAATIFMDVRKTVRKPCTPCDARPTRLAVKAERQRERLFS